MYKLLIRPFFFLFDPEKVHYFTFFILKMGFKIPFVKSIISNNFTVSKDSLEQKVFGLTFKNPIGLAAGFDKNAVLMGSDTGGEWANNFKQGNNFSVSIQAYSKDDADRLFNELSAGGSIIMPIATTFWESYFGMFTDKFGVQWMVSFDKINHK